MLPEERIADTDNAPTVAEIRGAVKRAKDLGTSSGWTWDGIAIDITASPQGEAAKSAVRYEMPA